MNKVVTLYFVKPLKAKKTMSSYITRTLEKGESIVLRGHYHWTFTACQAVWSYIFIFRFVCVNVHTVIFCQHLRMRTQGKNI